MSKNQTDQVEDREQNKESIAGLSGEESKDLRGGWKETLGGIGVLLLFLLVLYPFCRWMPLVLTIAMFVVWCFLLYLVITRFGANIVALIIIALLFFIFAFPFVFGPQVICSHLFF